MITPKVEAQGIRSAIKELKDLDKTLLTALRKDLRTKLNPFAKQIADTVPVAPALSGFARTTGPKDFGWGSVRPSIGFTPGKSRNGDHLVSIRINPAKGTRGLYVAELAGSRSSGSNAQGRAMIRNLNRKYPMVKHGGRFAYQKFRLLRPDAVDIATGIVNNSLKTINKRLEF